MSNLMRPIVNINGDSRKSLVSQRLEAIRGIEAAMKGLQETAPHGRNYLGDNERYNSDLAIYRGRFALLDKMRNEITDEAMDIHKGEPNG